MSSNTAITRPGQVIDVLRSELVNRGFKVVVDGKQVEEQIHLTSTIAEPVKPLPQCVNWEYQFEATVCFRDLKPSITGPEDAPVTVIARSNGQLLDGTVKIRIATPLAFDVSVDNFETWETYDIPFGDSITLFGVTNCTWNTGLEFSFENVVYVPTTVYTFDVVQGLSGRDRCWQTASLIYALMSSHARCRLVNYEPLEENFTTTVGKYGATLTFAVEVAMVKDLDYTYDSRILDTFVDVKLEGD
jgi:hypothetical protein